MASYLNHVNLNLTLVLDVNGTQEQVQFINGALTVSDATAEVLDGVIASRPALARSIRKVDRAVAEAAVAKVLGRSGPAAIRGGVTSAFVPGSDDTSEASIASKLQQAGADKDEAETVAKALIGNKVVGG